MTKTAKKRGQKKKGSFKRLAKVLSSSGDGSIKSPSLYFRMILVFIYRYIFCLCQSMSAKYSKIVNYGSLFFVVVSL